jgi:hypothetical protein
MNSMTRNTPQNICPPNRNSIPTKMARLSDLSSKDVSRGTNSRINRNQSMPTFLADAPLAHLFIGRDINNLHQFGPASSQVRREARLSGSQVIQTGLSPCAAASGTSNLTLLAAK